MKLARIAHKSLETPRYAFVEGSKVYPLEENYYFNHLHLPNKQNTLELNDVEVLAPVAPS